MWLWACITEALRVNWTEELGGADAERDSFWLRGERGRAESTRLDECRGARPWYIRFLHDQVPKARGAQQLLLLLTMMGRALHVSPRQNLAEVGRLEVGLTSVGWFSRHDQGFLRQQGGEGGTSRSFCPLC